MKFPFAQQAEFARAFQLRTWAKICSMQDQATAIGLVKAAKGGPLAELMARVIDDRELAFAMRNPQSREKVEAQKAAVAAGTLGDATWAGPLAALATGHDAWFASLVGFSLLDTLAQYWLYAPVGRKFPITAAIGTGHTVTEASWKPITKFSFTGATTDSLKAMGLVVVSNDLLRFGDQLAEAAIMAQLRNVCATAADREVFSVLKNGLTPIASTGSPRQDLRLLAAAVAMGQTSKPVIIAAPQLVKQMSLEGDAYGASAFPDLAFTGGAIAGAPVISCDALEDATLGSCMMFVDAAQLAGNAGGIDITSAKSASIQMTDDASGASDMISMFETDSCAIRAERWFNVERVRDTAAAIITHAHYTSGSSP